MSSITVNGVTFRWDETQQALLVTTAADLKTLTGSRPEDIDRQQRGPALRLLALNPAGDLYSRTGARATTMDTATSAAGCPRKRGHRGTARARAATNHSPSTLSTEQAGPDLNVTLTGNEMSYTKEGVNVTLRL